MRWISRSLPRSLHARMLALSLVATVIALVLAGSIIAGVLGRFVTAGIDRRLDSQVALLAASVTDDGRVDRDRLRRQQGALAEDPRWRWQIVTPSGTIGPADFPPLAVAAAPPTGPAPPPPAPPALPGPPAPGAPPALSAGRPVAADGRGSDGAAVHARRLTIRTAGGPVTITAAAPADVIRRPLLDALTPLLLVLGSLGGVLALLTLAQLRIGLRPLRRLREQVAAIRSGTRSSVDENQPNELKPLALELNALAIENARTLTTARLSAANLAHALKTPVAALVLELRDEPERAAQVARIDDTIRHHLARARAMSIDRRLRTIVAPALADLAATIARIHAARAVTIEQEVCDADATVAMDPCDLDELLGNLLDNAAKNARRRVTVAVGKDADPRFVRIEIGDDGDGIDAADRHRAMAPGVRLDERGDGDGFGLAIASELTRLYGGALSLTDAKGGGLCVSIRLPAALPIDTHDRSSIQQ